VHPTVTGDLVVGLAAGREEGELEAVSALTGQAMWSASLPTTKLSVMGVITGGGVVVVELGHGVGYAGEFVVTRDVIYDATRGRQLWSLGVTEGDKYGPQNQPIAYSQGLIVTGATSGVLTARNAHTGSVAWRRTRPTSCPQARGNEYKYDEHVAADGALLLASYRCASPGHEFVLVQRLAPRTGTLLWQWKSIAVHGRSPEKFIELNVVAAATQATRWCCMGKYPKPWRAGTRGCFLGRTSGPPASAQTQIAS
jgi:outer membrane protein assembly factor BamB